MFVRCALLLCLTIATTGVNSLQCFSCQWAGDSSGSTTSGNSICKDPAALAQNGSFVISDMGFQGNCVTCVKEEFLEDGKNLVGIIRSCHPEMIIDANLGRLQPACYDREFVTGVDRACFCDGTDLCNHAHSPYVISAMTFVVGAVTSLAMY